MLEIFRAIGDILRALFGRKAPVAPRPAPKPVEPRVEPKAPTSKPAPIQTKVGKGLAAALAVAIPFVAVWEGYSGRVYRDSVGVKTICYGQTAADGADFSKVYTKEECEAMLGKDLARYDNDLKAVLKPEVYAALPPHRHAALISFDYNLGRGNTAIIARYFNRGETVAGCNAILSFNRAGGRVLQGLVNRRKAERALCLRND
jgi:lysozyme